MNAHDSSIERALVQIGAEDALERMRAPGDIGTHGSTTPIVLVRIAWFDDVAIGLAVELYVRTATGDWWIA